MPVPPNTHLCPQTCTCTLTTQLAHPLHLQTHALHLLSLLTVHITWLCKFYTYVTCFCFGISSAALILDKSGITTAPPKHPQSATTHILMSKPSQSTGRAQH